MVDPAAGQRHQLAARRAHLARTVAADFTLAFSSYLSLICVILGTYLNIMFILKCHLVDQIIFKTYL